MNRKTIIPWLLAVWLMAGFFASPLLLAASKVGNDPDAKKEKAAKGANKGEAGKDNDEESTAAEGEESDDRSLWELLLAGGYLMIPLVICSIAGVTSAVERFQSLRRARLIPDGFLEGLQATIAGAGGSVEKGKTYCEESNTPAGRICTEGLSRISGGSSEVEKAVETAGNMEMDRLRRSLSIIRLVVVIAPLLGLVGTVYGMIGAFQGVEGAGEATDKATMLSKGIYQALITTAAGLTIAIPLMVVCHFLNAKIDSLSEDFNRLALRFMTILPTGGGGMAGVRAVPSQPVESAPVIGESAGQPTTA